MHPWVRLMACDGGRTENPRVKEGRLSKVSRNCISLHAASTEFFFEVFFRG